MRSTLALGCLLVACMAVAAAGQPAEDAALTRARKLLQKAILLDGHNDLPWAIRTAKEHPNDLAAHDLTKHTSLNTDLPRLRAGGVRAQFWSVYVPADGPDRHFAKMQLEQLELARRIVERYPNDLELALTASDVERIVKAGKIASLFGMEGGHAIENSLGALRGFYDLGARYMTLTHGKTLDWADAAGDTPRHGGLTRFGEEVVREMNRLGMLVDLSHVTPKTMKDALRVAEAPVIFSHSSARALCDVERNVPDDVLRLLPKNGGVVQVTFVAAFISQPAADVVMPAWQAYQKRTENIADAKERERIYDEMRKGLVVPKVTIAQVADHVEHVRKVAGTDHVGLGGDYDGNETWPVGMEDVSSYPKLFAELYRRGWNDDDLTKLAGANVLRVMREVEAAAKKLRAARPPSLATIEELDGPPSTLPAKPGA